jgi:hypothetical protein
LITHAQAYGGDKTFFRFDGTHNSRRPAAFYNLVVAFLRATLLGSAEHMASTAQRTEQRFAYVSPGFVPFAIIQFDGRAAVGPRALLYDREVRCSCRF